MLRDVGVGGTSELFRQVPDRLKLRSVDLPPPMAEQELVTYMTELGRLNQRIAPSRSFLGAGAQRRFSPAIVNAVISRPDFYTAYTPYQAEASQGLLQATYEFQSMIAILSGLDVAIASLYDGATALAEAAAMAVAATGRRQVVIAGALHPEYAMVLRTYAAAQEYTVVESGRLPDGRADAGRLHEMIGSETAALVVQQPNFFGLLEDPQPLTADAHRAGALTIAVIDPLSVALLMSPGEWGADIAVGDGQPLGLPLSFGGPYLGFIACRESLMRRMPGRLVGATTDAQGRRGFVLTLQAREQHIRREGATSNITTNHALMAIAATTYLARMGEPGLRALAELSVQRAHSLAEAVTRKSGYSLVFGAPFLWEFAVSTPRPAEEVRDRMLEKGILPGLPLQRYDRSLANALLVSVTELNDSAAMTAFVEALP
jgi:glycine dehydrogenase subunit 1